MSITPHDVLPPSPSRSVDYAGPAVASHRPISEWLGPSVLVPAYTLAVTLGYVRFVHGVATRADSPLSRWQSLFSAVNAATLTGFQQARNPADYTPAGQWLVLELMLAGTLFSLVAGGTAVARIARMRLSDLQIILASVALIAAATLGGGAALVDRHGEYFNACFLAASAVGNCGLHLGTLPAGDGFRALLVLLPLSVVGGLGVPVLIDAFGGACGRPVTRHTRSTLVWTAGVYLTLTLLLATLDVANARWTGYAHPSDADPSAATTVRAALVDAGREAVNARSAGFPFVWASHLPQVLPAVLVVAMLVGGGAGGTAGGVKVTTLAVLARGTADLRRGRHVGRPFAAALLYAGGYVAVVLLVTAALLIFESGMHLDRILFLATSAVGNVGLSHDPIDLTPPGLCTLSLAMMLGRVGPVLALWYLVEAVPEADVATA